MKTSKIIFISTFVIIGLFLLSFLIQVPSQKRELQFERETQALPQFSHLVIAKGANLQVSYGTSDSIILSHDKRVIITKPVYWTKGDTLIVDPTPNQKNFTLELICSGLKSISMTDSRVVLQQISLGILQIVGKNADVGFYDNVKIDSLDLKMYNESRFYCYDSDVNSVNLIVEKSKVEFNIDQLAVLKAELRDSSELSVQRVFHCDVKTDESSRYFSR